MPLPWIRSPILLARQKLSNRCVDPQERPDALIAKVRHNPGARPFVFPIYADEDFAPGRTALHTNGQLAYLQPRHIQQVMDPARRTRRGNRKHSRRCIACNSSMLTARCNVA